MTDDEARDTFKRIRWAANDGAGELLSVDDIASRVIGTKSFDAADAILLAAIHDQVGSVVKRLHREGTIENMGAGRASKWRMGVLLKFGVRPFRKN